MSIKTQTQTQVKDQVITTKNDYEIEFDSLSIKLRREIGNDKLENGEYTCSLMKVSSSTQEEYVYALNEADAIAKTSIELDNTVVVKSLTIVDSSEIVLLSSNDFSFLKQNDIEFFEEEDIILNYGFEEDVHDTFLEDAEPLINLNKQDEIDTNKTITFKVGLYSTI